jgi:hypothetical protein
MKTPKEIIKWLKANGCPVGGLTSTDTYALITSVNLCNLIGYPDAPKELFAAYRVIVMQMQPTMRHLAFHAIACELDWSHRYMIWLKSELPEGDKPVYKCQYE